MARYLPPLAAAAGGAALACLVGLNGGFLWSDFSWEALRSFQALAGGHVGQFLSLTPLYAGSFLFRAPAVLAATAVAGSSPTVLYYSGAAFCALVAAGAAFLYYLLSPAKGRLWPAAGLFLMAGGPLTVLALEAGHPEELLGAALLLSSLFAALKGRTGVAGLLLGAAVANKEWAVVGIGPLLVLTASREGWRRAGLLIGTAAAACLAFLSPFLIASTALFHAAAAVGSNAGKTLKPWSLWWFFGAGNGKGGRVDPPLIAALTHPLVVAIPLLLSGYLYLRARRSGNALTDSQAFALLSCALLARGALDSWGIYYYYLPLIYTICGWEIWCRHNVPPVWTLLANATAVLTCSYLPLHGTPSQTALAFACAAVCGGLVLWRAALRPGPSYPTSVRALGREVRIRFSGSPTTTSSSILTPSSPGR